MCPYFIGHGIGSYFHCYPEIWHHGRFVSVLEWCGKHLRETKSSTLEPTFMSPCVCVHLNLMFRVPWAASKKRKKSGDSFLKFDFNCFLCRAQERLEKKFCLDNFLQTLIFLIICYCNTHFGHKRLNATLPNVLNRNKSIHIFFSWYIYCVLAWYVTLFTDFFWLKLYFNHGWITRLFFWFVAVGFCNTHVRVIFILWDKDIKNMPMMPTGLFYC